MSTDYLALARNLDLAATIVTDDMPDIAADVQSAAAAIRELHAEDEHLHSWDGLMELLDEHFPEDLIPTRDDDPYRDPGPRIVSLIRRLDAALARIAAADAEITATDLESVEALQGDLADRVRRAIHPEANE